jgi:dTDP-glucose 4,6-dehydratase
MIVRALSGSSIPVYGDGHQVRDWLHVDDHVDGLLAAARLGRPGERYLFGARNERTNLDLAKTVCAILDELSPGSKPYAQRIELVPDRPGHDRRYAIDPSRAETELKWRPQRDFDSSLRAVVQWYLENEEWWRGLRAEGYSTRRIGVRS